MPILATGCPVKALCLILSTVTYGILESLNIGTFRTRIIASMGVLAISYMAFVAGPAWWYYAAPEDASKAASTQSTHECDNDHTVNPTRSSSPHSTQHLLFAVGSSSDTACSYYIIDTTTEAYTILEAPIELNNIDSLHLHWDAAHELIFALTSGKENIVDLYQIDPENPSFQFVASMGPVAPLGCSLLSESRLCASNRNIEKLLVSEYDLASNELMVYSIDSSHGQSMIDHACSCTDKDFISEAASPILPLHWIATSKPITSKFEEKTHIAIFDTQQASHYIAIFDSNNSLHALIETAFAIHTLGAITVEAEESLQDTSDNPEEIA